MGTYWRVRLAAAPGADLSALGDSVQTRLDDLTAQMSHWDETSLLSRYGRAADGSWTSLPDDFAAVMEAGLEIAQRSDGAFDPAAGCLTDLHGLGPHPRVTPVSDAERREALRLSGWHRVTFDRAARRLRQPGGLRLDLSGIAKGHATDMIADLMTARGVRHCLVEIGGECVGRGMRPDGDPWWVDLETPPGLRARPLRVALHQLAVATSGNYVRGDHTLDPRTGHPVTHGVASVSVLHARAMDADAWATAITVLGIAQGAQLAVREGLAARILAQEGALTREWLSPALERMLAD
ncbi:FAD:protein FMN transferase [Sphingobium lignivorans]|uniref:FAD:protein FMN transferase n=1 Tax=Sphingobium lignivorans TaxID=2735886 RepID=A0ABR6NJQ6_9SPHN|nr:FAD:protein FMN transferase [Sphingobium lignivorans]MBB5987491.1 thiamine biosynthesis lipoprotein [Sphingobium lignivorans]